MPVVSRSCLNAWHSTGQSRCLLLFLITATVAEGGLGIERTDAASHGCESDSVHLHGTADRRRDL